MNSEVLEEITIGNSELTNYKLSLLKNRKKHGFIAVLMATLMLLSIAGYRYAITKDLVESGKFMKRIGIFEERVQTQLQEEGSLAIGNSQLGKMSWTILHMATGSFPEMLGETLRDKFNTFLLLFAEFYPCRPCGSIFLEAIQQEGTFKGNTKREIMLYLCNIHNKISVRVGKQSISCEKVPQQWETYTEEQY